MSFPGTLKMYPRSTATAGSLNIGAYIQFDTGTQSVPNASHHQLTLPDVIINVGMDVSTADVIGVLTDGWYVVSAGVDWAAFPADAQVLIDPTARSVTYNIDDLADHTYVLSGIHLSQRTSGCFPFVAGDVYELDVQQISGSAVNVEVAYMSFKWVGPLS